MGGGWCAVRVEGERGEGEGGWAEGAWGAVAIGRRVMEGVEVARVLEVCDAEQVRAVQGREEGQARIEAAMA
ncbi:hypothetical protein B1218_37380, partial [Pseudomonas ogarae]